MIGQEQKSAYIPGQPIYDKSGRAITWKCNVPAQIHGLRQHRDLCQHRLPFLISLLKIERKTIKSKLSDTSFSHEVER